MKWGTIVVLLCVLFLGVLSSVAVAENAVDYEGWYKATDGFWYHPDNKYPHRQVKNTTYEKSCYYDYQGCLQCKLTPVYTYEYQRTAYPPEQPSSIEEVFDKVLAMKKDELAHESTLRERHQFQRDALAVAEAFGYTGSSVLGYSQNLEYGDPYQPAQFPAQVGTTQYGTYIRDGSYYGQYSLDTMSVINAQNELAKVKTQYQAEGDESWRQITKDLIEGHENSAMLLEQMNQMNKSLAIMGQMNVEMLKQLKPEAQARIREEFKFPLAQEDSGYQAQREQSRLETAWFGNAMTHCLDCHKKHEAHVTDVFPKGVWLDKIRGFNPEQREAVYDYVLAGECPPDTDWSDVERNKFVDSLKTFLGGP